jgi:hypothetical protein
LVSRWIRNCDLGRAWYKTLTSIAILAIMSLVHGIDDPLALWNTLNMSYIVIRVLLSHGHGILSGRRGKVCPAIIGRIYGLWVVRGILRCPFSDHHRGILPLGFMVDVASSG